MMKSYEVLDIEDNLVEAYLTDTIGRNVELNSFVDLLTGIDGNMSISIDGKWGGGKTFFCKILVEQKKIEVIGVNRSRRYVKKG